MSEREIPLNEGAAAPGGGMDGTGGDDGRRAGLDPLFKVRTADLEPYTGLRYVSKLFRFISLILLLMLVAEVITGVARQGSAAVPTLIAEASRLIVLAGVLWGIGDLAILLIDVGHDVRATRILLGRQAAHHLQAHRETVAAEATGAGPSAPPAGASTTSPRAEAGP